MQIGQKIKQARLEAGLSQRQLCGEKITRNMLSQIENGTARPSMKTLQYFAQQLNKPVSFFLEENTVVSSNQEKMLQALNAWDNGDYRKVLEQLQAYISPDPIFEHQRWYLEALSCLCLAEHALAQNRGAYAIELLSRAEAAGAKTSYYTPEADRKRLLLCFQAGHLSASGIVKELPDNRQEIMLRGIAALEGDDPKQCISILNACEPDEQWYYIKGQAYFAQGLFSEAAKHYEKAQTRYPKETAERLEKCYQQLEDYKMAYFYACKQRDEK